MFASFLDELEKIAISMSDAERVVALLKPKLVRVGSPNF